MSNFIRAQKFGKRKGEDDDPKDVNFVTRAKYTLPRSPKKQRRTKSPKIGAMRDPDTDSTGEDDDDVEEYDWKSDFLAEEEDEDNEEDGQDFQEEEEEDEDKARREMNETVENRDDEENQNKHDSPNSSQKADSSEGDTSESETEENAKLEKLRELEAQAKLAAAEAAIELKKMRKKTSAKKKKRDASTHSRESLNKDAKKHRDSNPATGDPVILKRKDTEKEKKLEVEKPVTPAKKPSGTSPTATISNANEQTVSDDINSDTDRIVIDLTAPQAGNEATEDQTNTNAAQDTAEMPEKMDTNANEGKKFKQPLEVKKRHAKKDKERNEEVEELKDPRREKPGRDKSSKSPSELPQKAKKSQTVAPEKSPARESVAGKETVEKLAKEPRPGTSTETDQVNREKPGNPLDADPLDTAYKQGRHSINSEPREILISLGNSLNLNVLLEQKYDREVQHSEQLDEALKALKGGQNASKFAQVLKRERALMKTKDDDITRLLREVEKAKHAARTYALTFESFFGIIKDSLRLYSPAFQLSLNHEGLIPIPQSPLADTVYRQLSCAIDLRSTQDKESMHARFGGTGIMQVLNDHKQQWTDIAPFGPRQHAACMYVRCRIKIKGEECGYEQGGIIMAEENKQGRITTFNPGEAGITSYVKHQRTHFGAYCPACHRGFSEEDEKKYGNPPKNCPNLHCQLNQQGDENFTRQVQLVPTCKGGVYYTHVRLDPKGKAREKTSRDYERICLKCDGALGAALEARSHVFSDSWQLNHYFHGCTVCYDPRCYNEKSEKRRCGATFHDAAENNPRRMECAEIWKGEKEASKKKKDTKGTAKVTKRK